MHDSGDTLRYAEHYVHDLGFSVIPIKPEDKRPLLKSWLEFQNRKPNNEEITSWFKDTDSNIGVVTGSVSGVTVVDVDPDADSERLAALLGPNPDVPVVGTPRGGFHLYYNYYKDIRNRAGALRGVDIRGDGGYVVAPPSVGVNGVSY
ncbi:MAG: bifunctional DNA primase/polymerase, partial [Syntrophales bacterium LBB04]|nr:bifunctional DNA primase/polymerase [Syntrophales bacterium LBB04]